MPSEQMQPGLFTKLVDFSRPGFSPPELL